MPYIDKNFIRLLPLSNEAYSTYEEFQERVNKTIRMNLHGEPTEDMYKFFKVLYGLDEEAYQMIRNNYNISYTLLRKTAGIAAKIVATEEEPLSHLALSTDLVKKRKSIVNREVSKLLVVDRTKNEYENYIDYVAKDDSVEVIVAKELFEQEYGYLKDDELFGKFYQELLDGMNLEVLDEMRKRVKSCITGVKKDKEKIVFEYVRDDILIKKRRYNFDR